MPITPDDKDWPAGLGRPCPEGGFDASALSRDAVGAELRANASVWSAVLARPDVRDRPSDDRWSPLEYGCHVRDVYRLYRYRLQLMLDEDDPTYPNWDQDVTAVDERYAEQDPTVVAREVVTAGEDLAAAFDAVRDDQWSRTGTRSDGARFTVETFARYLVHDPVHHLWDVSGSRA